MRDLACDARVWSGCRRSQVSGCSDGCGASGAIQPVLVPWNHRRDGSTVGGRSSVIRGPGSTPTTARYTSNHTTREGEACSGVDEPFQASNETGPLRTVNSEQVGKRRARAPNRITIRRVQPGGDRGDPENRVAWFAVGGIVWQPGLRPSVIRYSRADSKRTSPGTQIRTDANLNSSPASVSRPGTAGAGSHRGRWVFSGGHYDSYSRNPWASIVFPPRSNAAS